MEVKNSENVKNSDDVGSSRDVKRCENILFCYDVRLKEFYVFNKQVTESRFNELKKLNSQIFDGSKLELTEWTKEEDMTDEEKKENSEFYINKGYLKLREYEEAWAAAWAAWAAGSQKTRSSIKTKCNRFVLRRLERKFKDGKVIV